jgi:hypothetical protein
MIQRFCVLALAWTAISSAQSGLSPPLLGLVQDHNQILRLVHGIAGNFLLGGAIQPRNDPEVALNWAFSGRAGMVKTADHLLLLDGNGAVARSSAVPNSALFAFGTHGKDALYFIPETGELWRVGPQFDVRAPFSLDRGENARSIAIDGQSRATLAVCRGNELKLLSVDLTARTVARERDVGIHACPILLLLPDKLLYSQGEILVVRANDGEERRVKLPNRIGSFRQMGDRWIEIKAGTELFALQLTPGIPRLFRLPQTGPQ